MNEGELPLNIKLENAKGIINTAITQIIMEYGLPAFLVEGIMADVMLDVKKQSKTELLNSFNDLENKENKENKESQE